MKKGQVYILHRGQLLLYSFNFLSKLFVRFQCPYEPSACFTYCSIPHTEKIGSSAGSVGTPFSGFNSFAQRWYGNYNRQLKTLYGLDLEIADTAGLWGLSSMAITAGVFGLQSFADVLGTEQVSSSLMQGAFTKGDIISKLNAAQIGERTAIRTGRLLSGMRMTGTFSTFITVGATSYSFGARGNALIRGFFDSL